MKVTYCSFCRTRQDRLFGLSAYPDSFSICENCLNRYKQMQPAQLTQTCCFCGALAPGFEDQEAEASLCADCFGKFLKESETLETPAQPEDSIEEILIDWPVYFDASMDLIPVKVKTRDGATWAANFTTPPRITWEMEKGKRTGQWASGTYFCHPDLVFVEELTEDLIRNAIHDLWKQGLSRQVFRRA